MLNASWSTHGASLGPPENPVSVDGKRIAIDAPKPIQGASVTSGVNMSAHGRSKGRGAMPVTVVIFIALLVCANCTQLYTDSNSRRLVNSENLANDSTAIPQTPEEATLGGAHARPSLPVDAQLQQSYSKLAIVTTYNDDISWLLTEDRGGDEWQWRLPTEIYQVCDMYKNCQPLIPGVPEDTSEGAVQPLPGWPDWAEEWVAEACEAQRDGIVPASAQHSVRLATRQAGVPIPRGMRRRRRFLEYGLQKDEEDHDVRRSSVVNCSALTPLPLHIVPNRANEGLGYLDAIIRHYDDLPDLMLFMHGHLTSWHTIK